MTCGKKTNKDNWSILLPSGYKYIPVYIGIYLRLWTLYAPCSILIRSKSKLVSKHQTPNT